MHILLFTIISTINLKNTLLLKYFLTVSIWFKIVSFVLSVNSQELPTIQAYPNNYKLMTNLIQFFLFNCYSKFFNLRKQVIK